jgi:hypothetical protein
LAARLEQVYLLARAGLSDAPAAEASPAAALPSASAVEL